MVSGGPIENPATGCYSLESRLAALPNLATMRSNKLFLFTVACFALAVCRLRAVEPPMKLPAPADREVDFVRDVQPLLQKNCFSCHGSEHQEGGLRLDQKKRALDGGDSGVEIVAGKSAES